MLNPFHMDVDNNIVSIFIKLITSRKEKIYSSLRRSKGIWYVLYKQQALKHIGRQIRQPHNGAQELACYLLCLGNVMDSGGLTVFELSPPRLGAANPAQDIVSLHTSLKTRLNVRCYDLRMPVPSFEGRRNEYADGVIILAQAATS